MSVRLAGRVRLVVLLPSGRWLPPAADNGIDAPWVRLFGSEGSDDWYTTGFLTSAAALAPQDPSVIRPAPPCPSPGSR